MADVWYVIELQSDGDQMKCVKNTVFAAFDQKELMKNDNFSINEICNKYVNLIMQFKTDFCFYFVKDVLNFDKDIIWKLLFKLKKAYIEKQKWTAQQLMKQFQSSNAQTDVEIKDVFIIDSAAELIY